MKPIVNYTRFAVLALLVLLVPVLTVHADTVPSPNEFPFAMPWDDASPGTATDVSFLNAKPAGVNGAIVVKNGHFYESKTGQRVRFFGTNFTFDSDYPAHDDADKIAAHIAKLGFNIVRIHHHDVDHGQLWDHTVTDKNVFSATGIDRLDYLISALKKNGIYVDLNLHVSRQYTPVDGFPESVNHLPETYDKRIDNIDDHMIALQKQFAHDYLTHVNPYTGLSYTEDPCVAVIEINNENSLVGWASSDHNTFFHKLVEPFRGEVVAKWNGWLSARYGTQSKLLAAWTPRSTVAVTKDALNADTPWAFEDHSGAGTLTKLTAGTVSSPPDVEVASPQKPDQPWREQVTLSNLDLVEGGLYAVTFKAKADHPRDLGVYAGVMDNDWHHVGLDSSQQLDSDWKSCQILFQATKTALKDNRLVFVVGGDTGTVWLSDVKVGPVTTETVIPAYQSLDNKTIEIPESGTPAQTADFVRFLVDSEKAYADAMRAYLRDDLKVKANIVDTQMSYGNSASFYREAASDYADGHAYWQHPRFPHKPWDPVDWNIDNTPVVSALASGATDEFTRLALYRYAGKPYSVSEYNIPAPSDYQSEMYPEYATFAAFQDWDMIYGFDYGAYGGAKAHDQIDGFFDTGDNPAKAAFFPSAALIFRSGEFAPSPVVTTLNVSVDEAFTDQPAWELWRRAGVSTPSIFSSRIQTGLATSGKATGLATVHEEGKPESSISVVKSVSGAQYVAAGSNAVAVTGFVGGTAVKAGVVTVVFPVFGNNFAALTLTTLDRKALSQSHRLLLTAIGKAENLDVKWNDTRTSVGRDKGHGPVQAEGIPGTLTLPNSTIKHAWALDPNGARQQEVPLTLQGGTVSMSVSPAYHTVWYELSE